MTKYALRRLAGATLLLLTFGVGKTAWAQPIKDIILDEAVVSNSNGCASIRIQFNFPLSYKWHFPYESGDDLRISIDPVVHAREGHSMVFEREAVRVQNEDLLPLVNVIYDGQAVDGPYLVLHFSQAVRFAVAQDKDFHSIVVTVATSDGIDPAACTGAHEAP